MNEDDRQGGRGPEGAPGGDGPRGMAGVALDGRYLGGFITPGISVSTDALFARAARLPRVGIERPHKVIGTSTVSAIQSGLYYGYAGLVDGILRRMIEELGRRPRVVATGGLAPLIATASEFIGEVDLTLTLDGLRLVYERSRGAAPGA